MSGEAGAGARSTYFQIYYSSGMTVSVAMPPDVENNPHYISDYFKEADKPFKEKLKKVVPKIEKCIEGLINQYNLPITYFDPKSNTVSGAIIEDTGEYQNDESNALKAKNWFTNSKDPKAYISISFFTKTFSKITLMFTVNQCIRRSQLNLVQDNICVIFELN